jgi:3-deoxy-manno-octulosonate cytidylyltransferase (CMP-KDO synthetase)
LRRVAVIIPARYGAQRFPGKPIADLAGKPLISHVVERARRAGGVDAVAVATDDRRIAQAAEKAGAGAIMTGAAATGTDRVAEAARRLEPRAGIVVNLQGDEPLLDPRALEALIAAMHEQEPLMATLARPLEPDELDRPQVVKVVCDRHGDALYFSRAGIPHRRAGGMSSLARAHVGVYAFAAECLETFAALPPGELEREESLEQLRALENGLKIRIVDTRYRGFGVDTPEDLERARAILASGRDERGNPW